MNSTTKFLLVTVLFALYSCNESAESTTIETSNGDVPEWAKNVVWYQIFPERFSNGDSFNDPRPQDMQMTYPESIPEGWKISNWGSDWYEEDSWMSEVGDMDYNSKLQLRRYGGDLQGVLDKVQYLRELGITGVYFNPLNDAPSLHKYDPRSWRHIDRNFGPDPDADVAMINEEIPDDPATWQWTEADLLFLKLVEELHAHGIRVIMDFSWNHTGYDFWAVNDVRKNGDSSKFKDWYDVVQFDDPSTKEDETEIKGWWGFKYLPLIKEEAINEESRMPHEGNVVSESFKQHIYAVSSRWLDPNGDGKFDDGVDGFRMDVASEMTMGWWRDYRKHVKTVNPEALLVAEVWWFDWPDLSGPEKMVQGDQFDALMNYRWFALSSGLFKQSSPALKPSEFVEWYDSLVADIDLGHQQSMMNIVATHDTPRLSTSLFNENRFDQGSKIAENPSYKAHRPDATTWNLLKMYLLHQYSFVGSPHIWNGDELGMWGANDPDERKPIWWDDIDFDLESSHPFSEQSIQTGTVKADLALLDYYKRLIAMRIGNPVLALGELTYTIVDDDRLLFGYSRKLEKEEAIAVFNISKESHIVDIAVDGTVYQDPLTEEYHNAMDGIIQVQLGANQGLVLIRKSENIDEQ